MCEMFLWIKLCYLFFKVATTPQKGDPVCVCLNLLVVSVNTIGKHNR